MGYVMFAAWYKDRATASTAMYDHFRSRGHTVNYVWGKKDAQEWYEYFKVCDHAFIYNGSRKESIECRQGAELAKSEGHCGLSYYEGGILPARSHQFIDPSGVLGDSSFCVHPNATNDYCLDPQTGRSLKRRAYNCEGVDWVTKKHMKDLQEWKEKYIGELGFTKQQIDAWRRQSSKGDTYIFVPMQCWWDANLNPHNGWSPWTGKRAMHQMVEWIQNEYPDDRIIFRCHPADMPNIESYKVLMREGNEIQGGEWSGKYHETEGPLIELMCKSKLVIGMNSTCLLQSIMMGVPTRALGWGYVQAAGPEHACTKFGADVPGSGEADPKKQLKMVAAVKHRTFRWNDKPKCSYQLEEMHGKGKPCGETFWTKK